MRLKCNYTNVFCISVGALKFKTHVINNTLEPVWNKVYEVKRKTFEPHHEKTKTQINFAVSQLHGNR